MQQMQQQLQQLQQALQQAKVQIDDKDADRALKSRELDIKERDSALTARVNAEAQVIKREHIASNHSLRTREQDAGEMDDAQEVETIVDQVTARIAPTLQQMLVMITDMQKEDQAEDATESRTPENAAENRAEGGIENSSENAVEIQ
jgi:hypothetical protein